MSYAARQRLSGARRTMTGMTEYEALSVAYAAAVERHQSHRSDLYLSGNSTWRCPQCEPPTLRERLSNFLATATARVKRRRR